MVLPIDGTVQIFFLIIPSLFGVLAAFAITPDVPMEGELIVRDYYWAKRKAIFLPLAAYVLTALIADIVIVGFDKVAVLDTIPFIVGSAVFVFLSVAKWRWVHIIALVGWAAQPTSQI